jgi:hypothetical protein
MKIYEMVIKSGVCPDTPINSWSEIIPFCHSKGYLYVLYEKDEPVSVVCAYRIPLFDEKFVDKYPERELGTVLYIPWAVSNSLSITSLLYMFKQYIKQHDITELVYYKRNSETDLKRIKFHVKTKVAATS